MTDWPILPEGASHTSRCALCEATEDLREWTEQWMMGGLPVLVTAVLCPACTERQKAARRD